MEILTKLNDIERLMYDGKNLKEIIYSHIALFESQKNPADTMIANKLMSYLMMTQPSKVKELERELKKFFAFIKKTLGELGVSVEISVRIKDYEGYLKKVLLYQMEDKPLSRIMDIIGFRLTIGKQQKDDELSQNTCDMVVNMSLLYLINHGFILMEAEPLLETTNFKPENHPEVYVAQKSLIFQDFERNVKNYMKFVKENGYQRVHFYIKSVISDIIAEGQVGTHAIDQNTMNAKQDHSLYEREKYKGVDLAIDASKIKAEGFKTDSDGNILDDPEGILTSINIRIS